MTKRQNSKSESPDQQALVRVGKLVRKRLDANPQMHKLDTDCAEIYAMGGFLSADECDRLCTMIDAVARPSTLYEVSLQATYRTSSSGDMNPADPFVRMIERRFDDLLGINPSWGETSQGQRYDPGQQFKEHHDWFHTNSDYWARESKMGGQRSWTAMAFLNDVVEGGETHFLHACAMVKPQTGALLVWNNATPEGVPNPATLHAGTPPLIGVKYVLTKWYRTRRWRHLPMAERANEAS